MRDLRDPQKLGEAYLRVRQLGLDIATAVHLTAADYDGSGAMSNDPAEHHSKTPQDAGDLDA